MRIVSLVPGMTEVLFALGRGDDLVGRSHLCDYPAAATRLPAVSSERGDGLVPPLSAPSHLTSYHPDAIDAELLASLAPDLVVAHPGRTAQAAIAAVPGAAVVLVAPPRRVTDVLRDIQRVGSAAGVSMEASVLVERLRTRLARLEMVLASRPKPRVAVIEWASPLLAPGLWVPSQVEAGGAASVFGAPGEPSDVAEYAQLGDAQPDVVLLAFSWLNLYESQSRLREVMRHPDWLPATRSARVLAVDARSFFSRPGPRLVDGAELLAWALHRPHPAMQPPTGRIAELIEAGWVDLAAVSSRAREAT